MADPELVEPTEPINPTLIDDLAVARERAAQARLWLRVLTPVIQYYDHDPGRPPDVQQALDSTLIAACARIRRLVRSDLGAGDPR